MDTEIQITEIQTQTTIKAELPSQFQTASEEQTKVVNEQKPAVPLKAEKPKQTYKCLVCGKSYSKKTSLFTHHKTHPEHCVHCGENRGSSVENIYEHNLKHVNIRPFVCKLCGDSFLRNQQFVEHEKSHQEKKADDKESQPAVVPKEKDNKYKCKTCQSSYTNWKLFYKHQQESGHFNEKFLCEICGSEFHSNFLLSQHIRRIHKRTDEPFPCTSCSKVFASKPNLDSHIKKIHQNDNTKTHRCETCNNLFSSAPNLKQHIKTVHEVEKEYECQTCKKPFKAKNRLTRHEKEVHMGKNGNPDEIRMYNCDHCQKKYKRPWHQSRHNQMKHENSNTSTATSSSATPPTPEINGNLNNLPSANNNNNYTYHQMPPQQQQSPHLMMNNNDMSNVPVDNSSMMSPQHHQQNIIPPQQPQNVWNPHHMSHHQQQHTHMNYGNEMMDTSKGYGMQSPVPTTPLAPPVPPMQQPNNSNNNMVNNNGEYVHYAVNEQYSNKFNLQPAPPAPVVAPQVSYDSWNQHQQPTWDYSQQNANYQQHYPQAQPDWSNYYDPNQQHHAMYNNYSNYNCLNPQPPIHHHQTADPSMYNGSNYYYPPQHDPYNINQQQSIVPQQPNEYQPHQHSNYHQNPM